MDSFKVGDYVEITGGQRGKVIGIVDFGGFLAYEIRLNNGQIVTEAAYRLDIINAPETTTVAIPETVEEKQNTQLSSVASAQVVSDQEIINDVEILNFISAQDNDNTSRKTSSDINLVRTFMGKNGWTLQLNRYAPEILAKILMKFFIEARKQDGAEYEPGTLRGMLSSFDRYLKRHAYGYTLTQSAEFAQLREVLKAKQVQLKKYGKGNKPKTADHFTDADLGTLYESGQLGDHHPEALLRTVWLLNCIYFGMRGVTEHREMAWGDITLYKSGDGKEYLEYNERVTKTRTGKNPRDTRQIKPKAWALAAGGKPQRCPVYIYKLYKSLRPLNYCAPDDPFYIATNTRFSEAASCKWFKCQPVGVNKLGSFMKVMAKNAGLTGDHDKENDEPPTKKRLTNHSARKYVVQKLKDNNVSDTEIIQITGHKNVQSVNTYGTISEQRHQQIGTLLGGEGNTSRSGNEQAINQSSQSVVNHANTSMTSASGKSLFGGNIYGGTFNITVHHHAPKMGGLLQPMDAALVNKIQQLVAEGVRNVGEMRRHLRIFVETDLFQHQTLPNRNNRRYYPTCRSIKNHMYIATIRQRVSILDQENVEHLAKKWREEGSRVTYRPYSGAVEEEHHQQTEEEEDISIRPSAGRPLSSRLLFVHQSPWQARPLHRYGQEMCFLDATNKTMKYSLPLFFLAVKTNVNYTIVTEFVVQDETTESIMEALSVIKSWNPLWKPAHLMTDMCEEEIKAMESLFPDCRVLVCTFHREQAWERWVSKADNNVSGGSKQTLLNNLRRLANSSDLESSQVAMDRLFCSKEWTDNSKVRRWLTNTWLKNKERWICAYRRKRLLVHINTNNGLERQNWVFKNQYITTLKKCTLSGMLKILIEEFLPDKYQQY